MEGVDVSKMDGGRGTIVLAGRERKSDDSLFRVFSLDGFGGSEEERGAETEVCDGLARAVGRGTSVVCTTPCTTTSVPGGGN
jgi:hypothetical protein